MPIFGRFTERTQRVLNAAGREAAEVGTQYIGPEHLLLGLLSEDDRLPPEIEQHITYDQAKDMLSEMHLEGPELTERPMHMEMAPRTKKIIETAVMTAWLPIFCTAAMWISEKP